MKKWFSIFILAAILIPFAFIVGWAECEAAPKGDNRFTQEYFYNSGPTPDYYIVTDNETGAKYFVCCNSQGCGVTPLLEKEKR